jgi:hypothetical protein
MSSEFNIKDEQKDIDLKKRDDPSIETYMGVMRNLLNYNSTTQDASYLDKQQVAKNKINKNADGKDTFSIRNIKNDQSQKSYKNAFFLITDPVKEDEDITLKIKRETLISKLMDIPNIKTEKSLVSSFHGSVLNSLYLTLSRDSRKVLDFNSDSTNDFLFDKIIGYNDNTFSDIKHRVKNETILYLCEKLISLGKFNIDDQPLIHNMETRNTFKSSKPKIENTISEKKKRESEISTPKIEVVSIDQNSIVTIQTKEKDEDLNLEDLNFLENYMQTTQNQPVKEKIKKILLIINQSDNPDFTNKMKNQILKNLKEEYLSNLNELRSIIYFYLESETIQGTQQINETPVKREKTIENPFQDTYENQIRKSIRNDEKIMKSSQEDSVVKNKKKVHIEDKIVYMNSGWGVSDAPKKNINQLIASGNSSNKKPTSKKVIHSSNQKIYSNKSSKSNRPKQNNNNDSSGEWVVHTGFKK